MALEALVIPQKLLDLAEAGGWTRLTSEEVNQAQVDGYNRDYGPLTGFDCAECRNKGFVMYLDGAENRRLRECHCMAKRRSLKNIARSGLNDLLEHCTLDSFQTPEPWQREAKDRAKRFLTDCDGKWFVSAGAVGSGKTHLCAAVCGALLEQGREVRYMLWRDDGVRLKASVNDPEEYSRLIAPLKRVPVLYIDDFFKAGTIGAYKNGSTQEKFGVSRGDINLASELLNARYLSKNLITILSTERTIEEIMDIDEAIGSRIYERSKDFYLRNVGSSRNWRLKK